MKQEISIEYILSERGISQEISYNTGEFIYRSDSFIKEALVKSGEPFIDAWDRLTLEGRVSMPAVMHSTKVKIVDLFCGCGGFTEGVKQALFSAGFDVDILAAIDIDENALRLYKLNHAPRLAFAKDVNSIARGTFRQDLNGSVSLGDARFENIGIEKLEMLMQGCDVLLAGPPCQGHSNLNNHSRRDDPRNSLYLSVATYAALLRPKVIAIENVMGVVKDRKSIVPRTHLILESLGYSIHSVFVSGVNVGLPQTRNRHFTIAYRTKGIDPKALLSSYSSYFKRPRSVSWALDLAPKVYDVENPFYTPSVPSKANLERINWLHDMDEYDLPFDRRPLCHHENHSYKAVYGRLRHDLPSGTITTGFNSPGRGRYIHPSQRRVITACEASLIQGFSRSYRFYSTEFLPPRSVHLKAIGDAVSPMMARAVGNLLAVQVAKENSLLMPLPAADSLAA